MFRQSIALVFALMLLLNFGCDKKDEPPNPNIVATYKGGQITRKEVEDVTKVMFQGSGAEALKQGRGKNMYRIVVRRLVLENLIKEKTREKKLDKRKNFQHVMKHISEEININELHSQAHKSKIKVSESEIRRYYEDNRNQFEDSPLSQAREEIHGILQSAKEKDYFRNYLKELKKNAVITREYQLLKVPEPSDIDLRIKYEDQDKVSGLASNPSPSEKEEFKEIVRNELEQKWFKLNQNRTLFTIHGKRYTAGEFYQELQELPLDEREKFKDFEGRKKLMDQMIERLLS